MAHQSGKQKRGYETVVGDSESDDDNADRQDEQVVRDAEQLQLDSAAVPPTGHATSCLLGRRRYQLSLLATLAGGIGYAQRAALAVSIVRLQSVFGWNKVLQGQILSSFFLGCLVH